MKWDLSVVRWGLSRRLHADLVLQQSNINFKGGHGLVQVLHVRLQEVETRIDRRKSAIVEDQRADRDKHRTAGTSERYDYSVVPIATLDVTAVGL